jgi:hypothetical protein
MNVIEKGDLHTILEIDYVVKSSRDRDQFRFEVKKDKIYELWSKSQIRSSKKDKSWIKWARHNGAYKKTKNKFSDVSTGVEVARYNSDGERDKISNLFIVSAEYIDDRQHARIYFRHDHYNGFQLTLPFKNDEVTDHWVKTIDPINRSW